MLAACGPTTQPLPTRPVQSGQVQGAYTPPPPSSTEVPYYSGSNASRGTPGDRCGAGELQWLVGRQRSEIPVPVDVSSRRVTCTTCAVTEDYNENRLNIFYDRQSGVIASVRCG